MPTLWVSTLGDVGNDGSDYENALDTVYNAIDLASQGDTINVVNDGTYNMGTFTEANSTGAIDSEFAGTNWSGDIGLLIQGTDSVGNPEVATLALNDGGTQTRGLYMRFEARYVTIKGIRFDYSSGVSTTSANRIALGLWQTQPFRRIYDCEFKFGTSGSHPSGTVPAFLLLASASETGVTSTFEIARCLFDNFIVGTVLGSDDDISWSMHHCVVVHQSNVEYGAPGWAALTTPEGTRQFYNNTLIRERYDGTVVAGVFDTAESEATAESVHSNLCYIECGAGVGSNGIGGFYVDGLTEATTDAALTGYNLLASGPSLSAFVSGWTTHDRGYASFQYNSNYQSEDTWAGTNVDPNSQELTNVDYDEVFNSTTGAWTWTPDTYDHTLPWDMRPIVGRTLANGGGVVGAVISAVNTTPTANDDTYSVTAGQTLTTTALDGVLANDTDPEGHGLTASLITNVATGTLSLSNDGGFTYTPPDTYDGTVFFRYRATDDGLGALWDEARSVITVDPFPGPPPEEEAAPNYPLVLDSLPFYQPVLKGDAWATVRVQRNTNLKHIQLRHYLRDERWNEFTTRLVTVGDTASKTLNFGGVAESKAFMIQTDQQLTVTVVWNTTSGTDSFVASVIDCLLFDQVPVSSVNVSNTSSVTANVHLSVFE